MSEFIQNLQSRYSELRKSEKKIADYLQQHPQRLDLSITELASLLRVSETTISRFCRVIGYQGFQDLKLSMAVSLNNTDEFQNIPPDIHETDSTPEIAAKLADSLSRSIGKTQQSLNMGDIEAAVGAMAGAKQLLFFGIGGSAVIASSAYHQFLKAGFNCAVHSDGYMQTVSASMVQPGGVVVAVSNTGATKHVVDAVKIADGKGATTIGITSESDSPLAEAAQICLFTPLENKDVPLYGGAIDAKICQMYLVNLLYLGVLFKSGKVVKRNLKETANALRTYYNPTEGSR